MTGMFQVYGWHPTIGDPSVMGWITVGVYFLVSILALRLVMNSRQMFPSGLYRMQRRFWLIVCLLMLALGINKQLDLQSLITAIGRFYVERNGWLEYKRPIQVGVIVSILMIAVLCLLLFVYRMNHLLKTNWLAIAGLTTLMVFIVSRATSFHQMDTFISTDILGVRFNWLMELGGLTAIALSAMTMEKRKIVRN